MPELSPVQKPSRVRYVILVMAVAVAVLLYLDRFCLGTADRDIKSDLDLPEERMADILGAFYLAYALGQIPFGYLADRFGARRMLTAYMVIWSGFTGVIGFARGFVDLYTYRFACGMFEAGAYPACAGIIKRWIPLPQRGMASGIVSLGGRLGGFVTPTLTAFLMLAFARFLPEVQRWRPTFVFYGVLGVLLAGVFYFFHRDRPRDHPLCNAAEIAEIEAGDAPPPDGAKSFAFPWRAVIRNRSLWLSSFVQFGTNFGWVFFSTYLGRYLLEVHKVESLEIRNAMNSTIFFMSLPALILGGWMTDSLTKKYGPRWGRALPLALPRFVAAAFFASVPFVTMAFPEATMARAWAVVVMFGLVAFFSDLPLPALWAVNLDIGGRMVGVILGWGNMWGNLGGWRSPKDLNMIAEWGGWNAAFWTCGGVFALVAVAALFIDSREKLAER